MTQPLLFPELAELRPVPAREQESPTRRRTRRARLLLAAGLHPLSVLVRGLRLHPDAAAVHDRAAPGLRCGDCAHLRLQANTKARYLKCELYLSRCESSDIRAWWPACVRFAGVRFEDPDALP